MATIDELLRQESQLLGTPAQERQVQSPIQVNPQAEEEEQSSDPALDFFSSSPQIGAGGPGTKAMQDVWWTNFADKWHDNKFNSLEEYIDFSMRMVDDATGTPLDTELIRPFITQRVLEHMPKDLKQQLQQREAFRDEDMQQERIRRKVSQFNSRPENIRDGIRLLPDGKTMQVNPYIEAEQRLKVADRLQKQIDSYVKQKDSLRKMFQNQPGAGKVELAQIDFMIKSLFQQQQDVLRSASDKAIRLEDAGKDMTPVRVLINGREFNIPKHVLDSNPLPTGAQIIQ